MKETKTETNGYVQQMKREKEAKKHNNRSRRHLLRNGNLPKILRHWDKQGKRKHSERERKAIAHRIVDDNRHFYDTCLMCTNHHPFRCGRVFSRSRTHHHPLQSCTTLCVQCTALGTNTLIVKRIYRFASQKMSSKQSKINK